MHSVHMSKTKSQHYIPRFLLKHFCADGRHIFVTDLTTNKTYLANINNVAQENYFYNLKTMNGDISLEEMFSDLESKAAPIIDKIVATESIGWFSDEDFGILEDFILCQFYRTRKYVNKVKSFLQSNNIPLFDHIDSDGNLKRTIYCEDIGIDDNVAKIMSYNFLSHIEHDENIRNAIASMEWLLLKTGGKQKFIISDNPTVLNNHMAHIEQKDTSTGFDLPHSQIFLPISSKLMLVLTAKSMTEEAKTKLLKTMMLGLRVVISDNFKCSITGDAANCSDKQVTLFNEIQRRNAECFVFFEK